MQNGPSNLASEEEAQIARVLDVILDGYEKSAPSGAAVEALYLRAKNTGRTAVLEVMRAHGAGPAG
jgi:hypothetical protein